MRVCKHNTGLTAFPNRWIVKMNTLQSSRRVLVKTRLQQVKNRTLSPAALVKRLLVCSLCAENQLNVVHFSDGDQHLISALAFIHSRAKRGLQFGFHIWTTFNSYINSSLTDREDCWMCSQSLWWECADHRYYFHSEISPVQVISQTNCCM